jgi:hypothetical protein
MVKEWTRWHSYPVGGLVVMSKNQPPDERQADILDILRQRLCADEPSNQQDILDIRHQFGSVAGGLLYATLFVPDFCVVSDSVILDDGTFDLPEKFLAAKQASTMSPEDLEASFNWRELPYLFSNRDTTVKECKILAGFIVEAWKARLSMLFPQRQFVVRILSSDETGGGVGVGFRECKLPFLH